MGWLHNDDLLHQALHSLSLRQNSFHFKFIRWETNHESNRYGGARWIIHQDLEQARPAPSSYNFNFIAYCLLRLPFPLGREKAPSRLFRRFRGFLIHFKLYVVSYHHNFYSRVWRSVHSDSPWSSYLSSDSIHRFANFGHSDRYSVRKTYSVWWRKQSYTGARGREKSQKVPRVSAWVCQFFPQDLRQKIHAC